MTHDPCAAFAFSRSEWLAIARELSEPDYRARQIFDAIHVRAVTDFSAMTELSRSSRALWAQRVGMALPEIARRETSADGSVKYGLRLHDGALVETVFMPRGERHAEEGIELSDARAPGTGTGARSAPEPADERATVCVSSQTGCAVNCRFCVTGRLGAGRNLTAGEIVAQVLAARKDRGSAHLSVVFMGMGEPMANFDHVAAALAILLETISPRRVTVSTSGYPDGIRRLGRLPKVPNLAVSINAADQATREAVMPITKTYPLSDVVAAMREFPLPPRRRITAEYVLLSGVNDSVEDARKLARLLKGIPVKVNVIPFNPDPRYVPEYARPSETAIERFVEAVARAGLTATVRRSKGPDAYAACGQLKGREADLRRRRPA